MGPGACASAKDNRVLELQLQGTPGYHQAWNRRILPFPFFFLPEGLAPRAPQRAVLPGAGRDPQVRVRMKLGLVTECHMHLQVAGSLIPLSIFVPRIHPAGEHLGL